MLRLHHASFYLAIVLLCFFSHTLEAASGISSQEGSSLKPANSVAVNELKVKPEEKSFNPGEMIMEHVVDNHEWHIITIGRRVICIPLPVFLFCEGRFYSFWSSEFHNGNHSPKGFIISENT